MKKSVKKPITGKSLSKKKPVATVHRRRRHRFHLPSLKRGNQKLVGLGGISNRKLTIRVGTSVSEKVWLDKMELVFGCRIEREKVILGMPTIGNKREIFVADGYISKGNIVLEYNGSRWHGNPKLYDPNKYDPQLKCTYKDLYLKTLRRYYVLTALGYKVFRVWDVDWKKGINGSFWKKGDPV